MCNCEWRREESKSFVEIKKQKGFLRDVSAAVMEKRREESFEKKKVFERRNFCREMSGFLTADVQL